MTHVVHPRGSLMTGRLYSGTVKAYVLHPSMSWNVCRWQSAVKPLVGSR